VRHLAEELKAEVKRRELDTVSTSLKESGMIEAAAAMSKQLESLFV
jgi:hypothetical protein